MPLYEYIDKRTGERVDMRLPVEKRDSVPFYYQRVKVPARLNVAFGVESEQDMDISGQKALREMEIREGTAGMERKLGFDRKTLKRVWFDEPAQAKAKRRR